MPIIKPGSKEAIEAGCTCEPTDDPVLFFGTSGCPCHGDEIANQIIAHLGMMIEQTADVLVCTTREETLMGAEAFYKDLCLVINARFDQKGKMN